MWVLRVLTHSEADEHFQLTQQTQTQTCPEDSDPAVYRLPIGKFTVGRKANNINFEKDKSVSRKHAVFTVTAAPPPPAPGDAASSLQKPFLTVTDLGSTFGTSVNHVALGKDTAHLLKAGDLVRIGAQVSAFRVDWEPLVLCVTRMGKREKASLKATAARLGAAVVADWSAHVTHMTTTKARGEDTSAIDSPRHPPRARTPGAVFCSFVAAKLFPLFLNINLALFIVHRLYHLLFSPSPPPLPLFLLHRFITPPPPRAPSVLQNLVYTVKTVLALVAGTPIVHPRWLDKVLEPRDVAAEGGGGTEKGLADPMPPCEDFALPSDTLSSELAGPAAAAAAAGGGVDGAASLASRRQALLRGLLVISLAPGDEGETLVGAGGASVLRLYPHTQAPQQAPQPEACGVDDAAFALALASIRDGGAALPPPSSEPGVACLPTHVRAALAALPTPPSSASASSSSSPPPPTRVVLLDPPPEATAAAPVCAARAAALRGAGVAVVSTGTVANALVTLDPLTDTDGHPLRVARTTHAPPPPSPSPPSPPSPPPEAPEAPEAGGGAPQPSPALVPVPEPVPVAAAAAAAAAAATKEAAGREDAALGAGATEFLHPSVASAGKGGTKRKKAATSSSASAAIDPLPAEAPSSPPPPTPPTPPHEGESAEEGGGAPGSAAARAPKRRRSPRKPERGPAQATAEAAEAAAAREDAQGAAGASAAGAAGTAGAAGAAGAAGGARATKRRRRSRSAAAATAATAGDHDDDEDEVGEAKTDAMDGEGGWGGDGEEEEGGGGGAAPSVQAARTERPLAFGESVVCDWVVRGAGGGGTAAAAAASASGEDEVEEGGGEDPVNGMGDSRSRDKPVEEERSLVVAAAERGGGGGRGRGGGRQGAKAGPPRDGHVDFKRFVKNRVVYGLDTAGGHCVRLEAVDAEENERVEQMRREEVEAEEYARQADLLFGEDARPAAKKGRRR